MRAIVLSLFFGLAVAASGCGAKKDPAACKTTSSQDGETCSKCCKEAGASGHMWHGANSCTCL